MGSGNSGSIQSSSGGDEEYDSRAATDGIFMTARVSTNPMFDPLSNYMQQFQQNSMAWTRPVSMGSDPDSEIIQPMGLIPSFQFQATGSAPESTNTNPTAGQNQYQNLNQTPTRNPKKRSRASRRAPTTVLTTDTTNFKAMVQEFTGIPSPPFNNPSFMRNRFDLFGSRSGTVDGGGTHPQPPPYLRRPFPQKFQSPTSFNPPTTNNNSTSAASSSSTPLINYQLPLTQNSNPFNVQNPLLSSVLQTNPKYIFTSSSPPPSNSEIRIGGLDEFMLGLGHGNHVTTDLSGLPSLINKASEIEFNGNFSGNFPNIHADKGPESIAGRGEGTVESWICSSE